MSNVRGQRTDRMTTDVNAERARGWMERALRNEGVLYDLAGIPQLGGRTQVILDACATALAAAVRAKSTTRPIETLCVLVTKSCIPMGMPHADRPTNRELLAAVDAVRAHADEIPPVPNEKV